MNDQERMNIIRAYSKMKDSFDMAIQQAGGSHFSFERLEKMTAAELFALFCTNNIEFKYTGIKDENNDI